ncbi:MAG: TetR family transcriptional regulator [Clostridiaceae bacterium]|jgi:hypothetical protein|nr:TetR family transcriptional regulator [Clostridiaceae bacterium]
MSKITKTAISDCFIKLCTQKPVRKITVGEIIAECGISRQTFYNNFKDKYELINYKYSLDIEAACAMKKESGLLASAQLLYEKCLESEEYYRAIAEYDTQNGFPQCVYECSKKYYYDTIVKYYGKGSLTPSIKLEIEFSATGNQKIFLDWIKSGMNVEPQIMAKRILKCLPINLKALIRNATTWLNIE